MREGDDEKVRQALLKGENPNQLDSNGQPLLMVARRGGQLAVVDSAAARAAPWPTPSTARAIPR